MDGSALEAERRSPAQAHPRVLCGWPPPVGVGLPGALPPNTAAPSCSPYGCSDPAHWTPGSLVKSPSHQVLRPREVGPAQQRSGETTPRSSPSWPWATGARVCRTRMRRDGSPEEREQDREQRAPGSRSACTPLCESSPLSRNQQLTNLSLGPDHLFVRTLWYRYKVIHYS